MKSRIDETLIVSNARNEWNALSKLIGFLIQAAIYTAAFYGVVMALIVIVGN